MKTSNKPRKCHNPSCSKRRVLDDSGLCRPCSIEMEESVKGLCFFFQAVVDFASSRVEEMDAEVKKSGSKGPCRRCGNQDYKSCPICGKKDLDGFKGFQVHMHHKHPTSPFYCGTVATTLRSEMTLAMKRQAKRLGLDDQFHDERVMQLREASLGSSAWSQTSFEQAGA